MKPTQSLALLAALLVGAGCTCAPTGAAQKRFACTTSDECAAGYSCEGGECVSMGAGGGSGGGEGGGVGGGGPGGGAGGGGGVVDAGPPPLGLVFTSLPQSIPLGTCSSPVTFEVRRGTTLEGVAAQTIIDLAATPAGLDLFVGPDCSSLPAQVVLAPDASSGSFSFSAADGGSWALTLGGSGLVGATQAATVQFALPAGLAFVTTAQTVRAGDCSSAVTVELRDPADAPTTANQNVAVSLASSPVPGVTFFSDSSCTLPITQTTVLTGGSRATFYVSRDTGQDYTLTASLGSGTSASLAHAILPVVRSGSCLIPDLAFQVTCSVVPSVVSLTDSFIVYQVVSASSIAGAATVRCELDSVNSITCRRGRADQDARISWQAVEVRGATVRRASTSCDGGLSVTLPSAAPTGSSFVLVAQENGGIVVDDEDFNIARLNAAGTAVDFDFGPCGTVAVGMLAQVVTLPGISIDRFSTTMPSGQASRLLSSPPSPTSPALLAQWSLPDGTGVGICDRGLRGTVAGKDLSLFRGNGSTAAACTATAVSSLFLERIDFRALGSVQQVSVMMAADAGSSNVALTTVDRTRTLLFTAGQGGTGQGIGEAQLAGTPDGMDFLGEYSGAFELGDGGYLANRLLGARGSKLSAAEWTVFVVQLQP